MTVLLVTGTRDEINQFAGRFVFERIREMKPSRVIEALNAWAAKHVTGTVLVGTTTRIDISELFKDGAP